MIFIALGTQNFQLNRLLRQIDLLIEEGEIREPVYAQIGHSDYRPKYFNYKKFLPGEKFEKLVESCDLLITHSGVSIIMTGKKYKKPIIVFPRMAQYHEHVDDHQFQIAKAFVDLDFVFECRDEAELKDYIRKARNHKFADYESNRKNVVNVIREYIRESGLK